MKLITQTLSIAAVCGLMPVVAQAESPDFSNVHPGTSISAPYNLTNGTIPDPSDIDILCIPNPFGFTHWNIRFENPWVFQLAPALGIHAYRGGTAFSGSESVLVSESKSKGEVGNYIIPVHPNESTYFFIYDHGGGFGNPGGYKLSITGVVVTDPAVKAGAINAKASQYNWANSNYKKYDKRYKKYKKKYKKYKKSKNKKKSKKYKKKYKKDKKKRDSYRRLRSQYGSELNALYTS